MFIETLEFTIPMDLCDLFTTMKRGPRSNLEFPASVNSYGTTQDANIQVVVRSNKLTFKVDGVSSDASMISKSECKTLKLSVFDVDRSLMPLEEVTYDTNVSSMQYSTPPMSAPVSKRLLEHEQSVSLPPAKSSRTSYSDSPRPRSPPHRRSQSHTSPRVSENSHSKSNNDTPVNVKQEPEDPDLIEVEPDDIEPKRETPYMQIDYSSDVPHTQTSQAALERLSHPQSSHSQSPASSSSSFHQNVPHVPDYSDPGPSRGHPGDQTTDDFLVFQDDNEDGDDNEADYSNDEILWSQGSSWRRGGNSVNPNFRNSYQGFTLGPAGVGTLPSLETDNSCLYVDCGKKFNSVQEVDRHFSDVHSKDKTFFCSGCCAQFMNQNNYTSHTTTCQLLHNLGRKKVATCEECGKQYASNQKKEEHMNSQHRGITYTCSCGQTYAYKTGLDRHRKHTGHQPIS